MKILRVMMVAAAGALAVGLAVPYIDAGGYRERIQSALERALDRKVKVGKVRFNLLTGPGFTVEDVTIHDHPSIGIEPMAYVESLDARVRLGTLWTRRLSFSNLRLNNPTVNLSKSEAGVWNFQLLGRDAPATQQFPSIQVRSGRINFKFGDYKTIFYLSDSDLDVSPVSRDRLDLRFSGQPSRTDQQAQSFGRLLARGFWKVPPNGPAELDMNAELERSSIPDLVRLVEGHALRLHGTVSSRARVTGPINALAVKGQLKLEEVHRWDLTPMRGGGWDLQYQGTMDLDRQRIELMTDARQNPEAPFQIRFRASEYLGDPKFAALLEVKDAPASNFVDMARQMGVALPSGLTADGLVSGIVGYARPGGMQGQLALLKSTVRSQNTNGIEFRDLNFVLDGSRVRVLPSTAVIEGQTADVEGEYDGETGNLRLALSTRALNVAELQTGSEHLFGIGGVPVLEWCRSGSLRGTFRYERSANEDSWSGELDLKDARINVDGLADPVRVQSARVFFDGSKATLADLKGSAGGIAFRGEFIHERSSRRPNRLNLRVQKADLSDIEALLMPALRREKGFLARMRLRRSPIPEWLRSRRLSANVAIDLLTVAGQEWNLERSRAVWDGAKVELLGISARQGEAHLSGHLLVDLSGEVPFYRGEGSLEGLPYQSGILNTRSAFETEGLGRAVWENAKGSGVFSGEHLVLSPEMEFRTISGSVELFEAGRLRLSGIQAFQGVDSYSGQGSTQADGRILLELTTGKRQLRVAVAK